MKKRRYIFSWVHYLLSSKQRSTMVDARDFFCLGGFHWGEPFLKGGTSNVLSVDPNVDRGWLCGVLATRLVSVECMLSFSIFLFSFFHTKNGGIVGFGSFVVSLCTQKTREASEKSVKERNHTSTITDYQPVRFAIFGFFVFLLVCGVFLTRITEQYVFPSIPCQWVVHPDTASCRSRSAA